VPAVTRELARFAALTKSAEIPAAARREATRSLVNWMGCALGGSRHEAIGIALETLAPLAGPPQATVIGRGRRVDCLHAALLNGMSAHVLDFDDTHLRTLVHPSVPVASALLALAERRALSGPDFLDAFVLGVDVECRVANAIYASHIETCYITGTAGTIGAAAAAGRALGLDEQGIAWALGIAATQGAGLREMAGTMSKSFVHGRAAQNGAMAALLAQQGFTGPAEPIEGGRGFARVFVPGSRPEVIVEKLGEAWEILQNSYKPYACGVVAHPAIDGCIGLRQAHGLDGAAVAAIALRVHPLALKLTGIREPATGLEAKWSVFHSAAVAVLDGAAGERQYTDERLRDPGVERLRRAVSAQADARLRQDEAHVEMTLDDGRVLRRHVAHAAGSRDNPMTDEGLSAKFRALAEEALPRERVEGVLAQCWAVGTMADVGALPKLAL
jgi:2-methylcitrate dehydratase PrpD